MKDYYEMVNAVKSYLADAKVFRPEILGRIDRVYVFRSLEGIVVGFHSARIAEASSAELSDDLARAADQHAFHRYRLGRMG